MVTYRIRSAVRDVGKALGLSLDRIDALAKLVESYSSESDLAGKMRDAGIDPESDIGQQMIYLVNDLLGFPCLLYTSPSPRDQRGSRMPSSA